jgi:tyrosine-specific transport protein
MCFCHNRWFLVVLLSVYVVLAIFLPVAMVFKQRKTRDESKNDYRVKGGNSALMVAALCGVLIISAQFLQVFGVLPAIGLLLQLIFE